MEQRTPMPEEQTTVSAQRTEPIALQQEPESPSGTEGHDEPNTGGSVDSIEALQERLQTLRREKKRQDLLRQVEQLELDLSGVGEGTPSPNLRVPRYPGGPQTPQAGLRRPTAPLGTLSGHTSSHAPPISFSEPVTLNSAEVGSYPLPKPPTPPLYTAKDRREHTVWARAIEDNIEDPKHFPTEHAKCNWAKRFLGPDQRDTWDSLVSITPHADITWAFMKEEMLNCIGNAWEREASARDRIKEISQGKESPAKLLQRLRTQWRDIQGVNSMEDSNTDRIHEYLSAMNEDLRRELNKEGRWSRLSLLETRASFLWRAMHPPKRRVDHQDSYGGAKRPTGHGQGPRESSGPPRSRERDTIAEAIRKRDREEGRCYICHTKDHLAPQCPQRAGGDPSLK
jgi:hypothetical protein